MSDRIQVTNAKLGEKNCKLIADVRVLDCVTLIGCRLWQKADGSSQFASLPQRPYESEGKTKYAAVVEVSEGLMRGITKRLVAEHERLAGYQQPAGDGGPLDPFADEA